MTDYKDISLEYIAGIYDGEGYVGGGYTGKYFYISIGLSMIDRTIIKCIYSKLMDLGLEPTFDVRLFDDKKTQYNIRIRKQQNINKFFRIFGKYLIRLNRNYIKLLNKTDLSNGLGTFKWSDEEISSLLYLREESIPYEDISFILNGHTKDSIIKRYSEVRDYD